MNQPSDQQTFHGPYSLNFKIGCPNQQRDPLHLFNAVRPTILAGSYNSHYQPDFHFSLNFLFFFFVSSSFFITRIFLVCCLLSGFCNAFMCRIAPQDHCSTRTSLLVSCENSSWGQGSRCRKWTIEQTLSAGRAHESCSVIHSVTLQSKYYFGRLLRRQFIPPHLAGWRELMSSPVYIA